MSATPATFIDWSLNPGDDENFDSVSMQQSSVVDSDYAANQIWMHELKRALALNGQNVAGGTLNFQFEVVNNTNVNVKAENREEPKATEEKSYSRDGYSRKLKIFITIFLLLIFVVIAAVILFNKKPSTSTFSIDSSYRLIQRSEWDGKVSPEYEVKNAKNLIIMDTQSDSCDTKEKCLNFIRKRRESSPDKTIRENFFIAADGTVYEGCGFKAGGHTYDKQLTSYNSGALGISFIGNYSNRPLTPHATESLLDFIQEQISLERIVSEYTLYHQSQLTLNSNFSENRLFSTVQTLDHWKASRVLSIFLCG